MGPRSVNANVTVTVQRIPKEAVIQSGSVRLDVSPETFISEENGRERLTHLLKARVDTLKFFGFLHFIKLIRVFICKFLLILFYFHFLYWPFRSHFCEK